MGDDEIEELEIPPEDPTEFLERLDEDLDDLGPGDHPPSGPPLSRREIDSLVDRALDEEVTRLGGGSKKKKAD